MSDSLFKTRSGRPAGTRELAAALRSVGAHDGDVLFMHSGMSFGIPDPSVPRRALLGALWEAIAGLGVRTLCVPTFTFSFPNGEVYDPDATPSRMGVLGEHIRKQPGVERSLDPLMSVALAGEERGLVRDVGSESCGRDSTYHRLSRLDGVKFLFLGVRAGDCFTYMHHLEWQARVPYRYDRRFEGILRVRGVERPASAVLNVRYRGVEPNDGSYRFEDLLLSKGLMRSAEFGDGPVRCVGEAAAKEVYLDLLARDPNYFIREPFDPGKADPTFALSGPMVAM